MKIMRPLFHPQVDDIRLEAILHALSDPARAAIFTQVASADCPQTCTALAGGVDQAIPKSTLSQHFKVLREAGLVRSERKGVELHNTSRHADLHERFGPLISAIITAHTAQYDRQQRAKRARRGKA